MSRLRELIDELCPNGVEYKQLQDVVALQRGVRVVKKNLQPSGLYPVYQNSLIPLGYHNKCNCQADTTFIICAGAAGGIGYSDVDFWAADDCFYVEHNELMDEKYVFYCLQHNQHKIDANVRRASIPRLPRWSLDELIVPVPPIEVQREVVRILDSFQELDDALTAEIEAREKQANAYKERMLNNAAGSSYTIKDLCLVSRGKVMSKGYVRDHPGKYPVYSSQTANNGTFGTIDTYVFDGEYITWTTDGANAGSVFLRNGKFSITNVCGLLCVKDTNIALTQYLCYWLQLHAKRYVSEGMGNPKLMSNVMSEILVTLPSLSDQMIMVNQIESMYSLLEALLYERNARRSQFEYYRDNLLAFPEKPDEQGPSPSPEDEGEIPGFHIGDDISAAINLFG